MDSRISLGSRPPSVKPVSASKFATKRKMTIKTMTFVFIFIRKMKKSLKNSKYRNHILNEWFTTQQSYRRDLKTAAEHIKRPMMQMKMISKEQENVLFPEFDGMINLSMMMSGVIEMAQKHLNPNKVLIGRQLNSFANGYKLYGAYFGSHPKIQKLLSQLTKNHEHKMKQIEANMQNEIKKIQPKKQNMTIKDCMEQPLYRLFKYVLFMKDYIKRLPRWHPDYAGLNVALKTFHDINNSNNELMKTIEEHDKKVKLDALFGGALKNTRTFITEMQADTIYSRGKIYLFNDLVIITKILSTLGVQKQQKFDSLQLNQFSYVSEQQDLKYFKNILILIGKQQCIHLLFPEQGSRFQVYKLLNKIIRELRVKEQERRRVQIAQKTIKPKAKLTFTLKQQLANKQDALFQPQFRTEILGIEVRPLTVLSNDTVYVTRFMMPYYYQDQYGFRQSQGIKQTTKTPKIQGSQRQFKLKKFHSLPFDEGQYSYDDELKSAGLKKSGFKCINQRIQMHFSQLQQIYTEMISQCSQKLPNIDPITKDINIYSKGKKKTKSFEMRKFFIEQFFNFVFRYQQLLYNPIWFIQKLRVNQDLWNYTVSRNQVMKYPEKNKEVSYGYDHCKVCNKGKIQSVQEFQHYRGYYLNDGNHLKNRSDDRYCFNFFNLLRIRLLYFSYICFNNLQRILLFYHYLQGRLDYCFMKHRGRSKTIKVAKVFLASVDYQSVGIQIDGQTTAGEIVDELGASFGMKNSFDYDLVAIYGGKFRILDRDQFLQDTIKSLDIKFEQRKKHQDKPESSKTGFFNSIKQLVNIDFIPHSSSSSPSSQNKIYFTKTTYLHKSLQMKSINANPAKKKLEVQKIFWAIKHGMIKLSDQDFITMAGYFYCIKEIDKIQYFSSQKFDNKVIYKLIPADRVQAYEHFGQTKKSISIVVQKQRPTLIKYGKKLDYLYSKIFQCMFELKDYYTYYMLVDVKQLPEEVSKIPIAQCLLGVNYKNIIVTKSINQTSILTQIPIEDADFYTSVFSIFITHPDKGSFRFDTKMVYHFGEIARKYQTIANKFPQHRA